MAMQPLVIVLGGPNGAGKSTASQLLLPADMPFLNADEVAKSLPGYPSPGADARAGRLVLERMNELGASRTSFAVESTLAGRSLAVRIGQLREAGYLARLVFFWTRDAEFSIERVASRVRAGGHAIPEAVIRPRHAAGLRNFFALYRPLADKWEVFNSAQPIPTFVAEGRMNTTIRVHDPEVWSLILEGARHD